MIDPKLNELPVSRAGRRDEADAPASERQTQQPRRGLSINETIAGDANLSVGSQGVNVSGVSAGSGAGAGSTYVTPGGSDPRPQVVSGGRSTGTTVAGDTGQVGADSHSVTGNSDETGYEPSDDEISSRAYECWCERGNPHGSPEVDWERARQDLRSRSRSTTTKTNAATAS